MSGVHFLLEQFPFFFGVGVLGFECVKNWPLFVVNDFRVCEF